MARFRAHPSLLLNPRLSFVGFLLVFFLPITPRMQTHHLLAVVVGAAYFLAGTFLREPMRIAAWPRCQASGKTILAILSLKAVLLCFSLGWDFSPANLIVNLAAAGVAQKENVAGAVVFNTVLGLLLWKNIVGLCQQRRLGRAMLALLAFELLSLQTGRFLLTSQLGLIVVLYYEVHGRRFNLLILGCSIALVAALFPLLHAVRSGDIAKGADVYTLDYLSDILLSDASPGSNFLDLAEHVDEVGGDNGAMIAVSPLQFIPRAIWSDKPITSLQARYTKEIYGIDPLDGVSFTFTIFDSYSSFGMASIAVMSLFWGVLFMFMYTRYLSSTRLFLRIQFALMLINAFNFYRGNLLDFAGPILVSFAIAIIMDRLAKPATRPQMVAPRTA